MGAYPYRFRPLYKGKIWGGRNLQRLFGRSLPPGSRVGESWELADLPPTRQDPDSESVVSNGPDAGRTIRSLMEERAGEILGRARPWADGRFPLLLKLLDANRTLSLQVHPDENVAGALGPKARPKTECWYVLHSRGGFILKGLCPGVTCEQFRRAIGDDEAILKMVRRVEAREGDFHYLPGGTLHALGAGVVVAEIQTPSDTTFRITDWGRGRAVHVEEAMRSIHFGPDPPTPPGAGGDVLVQTAYFAVSRRVLPVARHAPGAGRCRAWMVLGGRGRILCHAGDAPLEPSATVLLPAECPPATLEVEEEMTFLEIALPE